MNKFFSFFSFFFFFGNFLQKSKEINTIEKKTVLSKNKKQKTKDRKLSRQQKLMNNLRKDWTEGGKMEYTMNQLLRVVFSADKSRISWEWKWWPKDCTLSDSCLSHYLLINLPSLSGYVGQLWYYSQWYFAT